MRNHARSRSRQKLLLCFLSGLYLQYGERAVLVASAASAPTARPTPPPTAIPTRPPSVPPTSGPTLSPVPTLPPTLLPSTLPTLAPTAMPTLPPTASPMLSPTASPTLLPTDQPSPSPSMSSHPTTSPQPTLSPAPSLSPTFMPTSTPTRLPTPTPSLTPSAAPSQRPIPRPTRTNSPTLRPSWSPTRVPTPPTPAPSRSPRPLLSAKEAIGVTVGAVFFCMIVFFLVQPRFTTWRKTEDPCDCWVQYCGDQQTQDALQTLMGHHDDAQEITTAPEYLAHMQQSPLHAGAAGDVEMAEGQDSRLLSNDAIESSSSSSASSSEESLRPAAGPSGARWVDSLASVFGVKLRAEEEVELPLGPMDDLGQWLESVHKGYSLQFHETFLGLGYEMNDLKGIPEDEMIDLIDQLNEALPTDAAARLNSSLLEMTRLDRLEAEAEAKRKKRKNKSRVYLEPRARPLEAVLEEGEDDDSTIAVELIRDDDDDDDDGLAEAIERSQLDAAMSESLRNGDAMVVEVELEGGDGTAAAADDDDDDDDDDRAIDSTITFDIPDEDSGDVDIPIAEKVSVLGAIADAEEDDDDSEDINAGIAMSISMMDQDDNDAPEDGDKESANMEVDFGEADLEAEFGEEDSAEDVDAAIAMSISIMDQENVNNPKDDDTEVTEGSVQGVAEMDADGSEEMGQEKLDAEVDAEAETEAEAEAGAGAEKATVSEEGPATGEQPVEEEEVDDEELQVALALSESLHAALSDDDKGNREVGAGEETPVDPKVDDDMKLKSREHISGKVDRSKVLVGAWLNELEDGFNAQFGTLFENDGYETLGDLLGMPDDELMGLLDNLNDAHPDDGAKVDQISKSLISETLDHKKYVEEIVKAQKKEDKRKLKKLQKKRKATKRKEEERIEQRRQQMMAEQAAATEAHYALIAKVDADIDTVEAKLRAARRNANNELAAELMVDLIDARAKREALTEDTGLDRAGDEKQNDSDDDIPAENPDKGSSGEPSGEPSGEDNLDDGGDVDVEVEKKPTEEGAGDELAPENVQPPKKKSFLERLLGGGSTKKGNQEPEGADDESRQPETEVDHWLERIEPGFCKHYGEIFYEAGYEGMTDLVGIPEEELLDLIDDIRESDDTDKESEKVTSLLLVLAHQEPLPIYDSDDGDVDFLPERGSDVSSLSGTERSDGETAEEGSIATDDGVPVAQWLEGIRPGYGERFGETFRKMGYKTVNNFLGMTPQGITEIITKLRSDGEKKPTLQRIMDTLAADAQRRMMEAFQLGISFSEPQGEEVKKKAPKQKDGNGESKDRKKKSSSKKRRKRSGKKSEGEVDVEGGATPNPAYDGDAGEAEGNQQAQAQANSSDEGSL